MNQKVIHLRDILIKQKNRKEKGNIYHWSQVSFAYNSNRIEGSKLTEEQTEQIFETNNIFAKNDQDLLKLDDLIEARNHFKLFDHMLDTLDEPLTKEYLITMNKILKRGTSFEDDPRYNVGGFKVKPNIIGVFNVVKTTPPEMVENEIEDLLLNYYQTESKTLHDIVDFHVQFERIHPFGDGNGRVGRVLMFKECLTNGIMPFIILDSNRDYYIRGLREWDRDHAYLMDTIGNAQDFFDSVCQQLELFEEHEEYHDIEM